MLNGSGVLLLVGYNNFWLVPAKHAPVYAD